VSPQTRRRSEMDAGQTFWADVVNVVFRVSVTSWGPTLRLLVLLGLLSSSAVLALLLVAK
jgi:hypothetical protein